jgi:hypothetical protein
MTGALAPFSYLVFNIISTYAITIHYTIIRLQVVAKLIRHYLNKFEKLGSDRGHLTEEKSLVKLTPGAIVIKLFVTVIYCHSTVIL